MRPERYILGEYADSLLYRDLALAEKDPTNKAILEKLAEQEHGHYLFWKKFAPSYVPQVSRCFLLTFRMLRRLFGLVFTIKFLERHERAVIEEYKKIVVEFSGEDQNDLKKIIEDEKEHEKFFIGQIQETVIIYIGSIALGLADAIVEITGVHAGFLGVTSSTLFAGISGLIVGFSAAISMGSAAYLQAKQDPHRTAWLSAVITGISYILSAILLAIPYFFTHHMSYAFAFSTLVGIVLIAFLTFYSAVVFDRRFWREFLETVALILITAIATFLLGKFLGKIFGIYAKT